MKLKPLRLALAVVLLAGLAVGAYFVSRSGDAPTGEKQLYTCSMHPEIIRDKPGDCPICGMKLTPIPKKSAVKAGERKIKYYESSMNPGETSPTPAKDSMGMDLVPVYEGNAADSSTITIDPVTIQKMNLRTALVIKGPLQRTIRTVGVIDFDETTLADVTTKIKGWVEKLYVDSTGQQVHKGDPLFEFYSPELYSAQTEYLLVLSHLTNSSAPGANALKTEALTKLKYYDVSDAQIAELESTREAKKTLRVNAPRDGVVVEKLVVQGQMVDAGMKLYRLADLAIVWVQAQIYEQDLPFVQLGQEAVVSLSYLPDRKFRGRVTYIYPTVDDKTRTAHIRMEFHNPGYFMKPGMFATVELASLLDSDAVLVPDSAVLRSGEQNTVFIALDGGRFEPRSIQLGARGEGDVYQVLGGLKDGARVVTSGQFMLDSESQLREAIQKMQEPAAAAEASPTAGNSLAPGPVSANSASSRIVAYVCPMPEHVAIQYDHPGKCPLCGMELVPVTADTLGKLQPGGEVDYYVCPMPEHADHHYDKPGKCPICGMTLIPIMKAAPLPKPMATEPADATNGH